MIGLIIGIIAGIYVGKDAKKNNMNPWLWGILTFLILIVGLPAYLIARSIKRKKGLAASENEDILDN